MKKVFKRTLAILLGISVVGASVIALKLAVIDHAAGKKSQCDITDAVSDNVSDVTDDVTDGFKREHVMVDWKALNQSYIPNYLSGSAVPMDGTNGNPNYLVPGQTEDMIPQGLTYLPQKDWVLVSSYDKGEKNPSVVFALDRETGNFAAQFNLYTSDGEAWKCHAGGIAVSEHNLYVTSDSGVAYFPLDDLDVENGTVKDIKYKGTLNFGQLGKTYSAYISASDGMLWAGNFYSNSPLSPTLAKMGFIGKDWVWKANDEYFNAILGYKLSGDSSEEEWANLEAIKDNASNVVNVDNTMDCIQGISFRKIDDNTYTMYLSRTVDGSIGAALAAATVDLSENTVYVNESNFKLHKNLPGAEGIVFIGDDIHILYESGALSNFDEIVNKLTWNQYIKDCTDVIWKVNEGDLA